MNMPEDGKPLVSVVIPCYNSAPFLLETLESVARQTWPNYECIVVDNGSTDESAAIVTTYSASHPRFRLSRQDRRGVSATRNKGIAEAKGKYILPLDADDLIDPTYIAKAVEILEARPEVKVVYCEAAFFGERTGKWPLQPFSMPRMLVENLIFCTSLFRKSDFDKTQGYRESMATGFEDWDFWLGFISHEREVYRIPEVLFYYRIRSVSRNNALDEEKVKALRRQLYNNHKDLYDRTINVSDMIYDYYRAQADLADVVQSKAFRYGQKAWARREFVAGKIRRLRKLFGI